MNPTWQPDGEGIQVMQANGARLVTVYWVFTIDKLNTSSEAALQSSTAALRQRLLSLVNGERASFDAPKSETEDGPPTVVRCWARGIIG